MKCKEVKYYLNDYLKGKLIDEMRNEIEIHVKICHSCKEKSEELKTILRSSGYVRKKIHQGKDFWEGISYLNENISELRLPDILYSPLKKKDDPKYKLRKGKKFFRSNWIAISVPLTSILLAIVISILYFSKTQTTFWQVENLKGNPVVGNKSLDGSGVLPLGEWLKTDASSEARLKAGIIGDVDVEPVSKIQLLETNDKEYKLYLKVGKISAKMWSPPGLFKIETPAGEAIDLGCAFNLKVDNDGSSHLFVTEGWAALKSGKDISILPAGAICDTKKNIGCGTPYFGSTSVKFKAALSRFDFETGEKDALTEVLENAERQDAMSLWYLLKKAKTDDKEMIYDRLAEIVLPPEGVTYDEIMNGDNEMLLDWWGKLGCGSKSLWSSLKNY